MALSLAFPTWSRAQSSDPLTLQECIEIALEKNPLVLSAADYYRASLARINQARALPQPSIGYDSDLQPSLFDFGGSLESYFGITFELPFPTKLSAQGNIASKDAEVFLSETDLLKLDLVYLVKEGFFALLLAQGKLAYAEDNLQLAQDFAEQTELMFQEGEVAEVEALRARVEAAGAMNMVRAASNEVRLARAVLNFHLGRRDSEPVEVQGELQVSRVVSEIGELKELAYAMRPETQAIELALEREQIARNLARQSYVPDLEFGINRHRIELEPSTWQVVFGFTVPLFFWQPKRGQIAEAEANISGLTQDREQIKNSISLEVEQAYREAVTSRNLIELYESDMLRQAEEVYNMFLFSFQEGELGGLDLIASRRALLEARQGYLDALYMYAVAISALERATGQGI
jgi:cobalt-zinc-cadmium efflux system outer membrane protein